MGNTAYLVAIGTRAQWTRNLHANPTVSLRIRGGNLQGTARGLEPCETDLARAAYCDTLFPFDRVTHLVHMRGRPTSAGIRALLEHWCTHGEPVAVAFAPPRLS